MELVTTEKLPKTKREYYDLLVNTSLEGGFPARRPSGRCKYRTGDGKACAVGLLILDEDYDPKFEDMGSVECDDYKDFIEPFVNYPEGTTTEFLSAVQKVHDRLSHGWDHNLFVKELNEIFGIESERSEHG